MIHGAALFRREMTATILTDTFAGIPAEVVAEVNQVMGMELTIADHVLTSPEELAILLISGAVFLIAGAAVIRFGKKADR